MRPAQLESTADPLELFRSLSLFIQESADEILDRYNKKDGDQMNGISFRSNLVLKECCRDGSAKGWTGLNQ